MNPLAERLSILHSTGTITDRANSVTEKVIEKFVNEGEEEKYTMLITHLAMAISRIDRNEELSAPPEAIMAEIKGSGKTPEALENIEWIETELLGDTLPTEERDFLLMHFVTVLSQ